MQYCCIENGMYSIAVALILFDNPNLHSSSLITILGNFES